MYINEIFKSKEAFVEQLIEDFKVTKADIGFVNSDGDFDDYVFICTEDESIEANFFYMKGNSGRIIIVEEAIHHTKGE